MVVAATHDEALGAVDRFMRKRELGDAGATVVIEERLPGEEASFHVVCDGERAVPLAPAQDHKRVFDGDRGPNTGGMGAYAPAPIVTPEVHARVLREIVEPTLAGMAKEGAPFRGVLFVGLMIDAESRACSSTTSASAIRRRPCSCRPTPTDPLFELLDGAARGDLAARLPRSPRVAVRSAEFALSVVMAAEGYPGKPRTGDAIDGLGSALDGRRLRVPRGDRARRRRRRRDQRGPRARGRGPRGDARGGGARSRTTPSSASTGGASTTGATSGIARARGSASRPRKTMADIAPLTPLRYDLSRLKTGSRASSRPRTTSSHAAQRAELAARDPHNVVQLILPEGEGDAKYANAAKLFTAWCAEGVLVRDDEPAFYRYDQTLRLRRARRRLGDTRRGFLALVRLVPFSERIVLPHERTLSGPKEDRLKLFRATRTNLSPGFMLYRDPAAARSTLRSLAQTPSPSSRPPTESTTRSRRCAIADAIRAIVEGVARSSLLIADGHHRYETALRYAQEIERREPAGLPTAPSTGSSWCSSRTATIRTWSSSRRTGTSTACLVLASRRWCRARSGSSPSRRLADGCGRLGRARGAACRAGPETVAACGRAGDGRRPHA